MIETTERFLRDIAERIGLHSVDEVRLFPPLRQGGVETGVAVVAALPLPPEAVLSAVPVVRVIVCPLTGMSEVACTTVVPATFEVIVTVQLAVAPPPV